MPSGSGQAPAAQSVESASAGDSLALAKDLLKQTDAAGMAMAAMEQQIQTLQASGAAVPPGFFDAFRAEIDQGQLTDAIAQVYARNLTPEEMKAALTFFRTPEGQSFIKKQPAIMRESSMAGEQLGRKWGEAAAQKVQQGAGQ